MATPLYFIAIYYVGGINDNETVGGNITMSDKKAEDKIFLTSIHHSDLTWQFSYEEYDEIREKQLNIVMDFLRKYPGYGFIFDQAYVLENYLQRNPEKLEPIIEFINKGEGTLELIGGYSIPDMNLITGESFLRNCMLGREYYQKMFGYAPECASLMDSFGTPVQTPQMLAILGYQYLAPGRMPNAPETLDTDFPFVWQGAAGTEVTVVPQNAGVDKSAYVTNVPIMFDEDARFIKTLTDLQNTTGNILAYYMTEIQMFDERFFRHMEEVNAKPDAKRKVTFGRLADYCKTLDKKILPVYKGEFNPIFTGCYTTRIGVKQKIRAAENAMFRAELACAIAGKKAELKEEWKQISLGQFHDAACGCHHDVCNKEVMEKLQFVLNGSENSFASAFEKGSSVAVLNPSASEEEQLAETTAEALPAGVPVQRDGEKYYFSAKLPAFGVKTFEKSTGNETMNPEKCDINGFCGETDYFKFDFTNPMPEIQSKRYGTSVFGQKNFGEILFRHESGSMWDEVLREVPYGAEYQEEAVCDVEAGNLFVKVTTQGQVRTGHRPMSGNSGDYWPGFGSLSFQKEYIFPYHLPYFRLRLTVNFTGYNTKVSLRIPVEVNPHEARALFDTPFAAVERKPYFEVPCQYQDTAKRMRADVYTHAKGDYPALHWVDYSDHNVGISIANTGTPGHQLVGKDIYISLLRSGTRCQDGTMYPQHGSYENGKHVFEFAFTDHGAGEDTAAISLGGVLNRAPVCIAGVKEQEENGLFKFSEPNIVVSAVYSIDAGILVRAYEILGKETLCTLSCSDRASCFETDVYGEKGKEADGNYLKFLPFEIKTFVLKRDN